MIFYKVQYLVLLGTWLCKSRVRSEHKDSKAVSRVMDLSDVTPTKFLMHQWVSEPEDGTPPHAAIDAIHISMKFFYRERIISHVCDINWSARFPAMTSSVFFLCENPKENDSLEKHQTLQQLKNNNQEYIESLGPKTLRIEM